MKETLVVDSRFCGTPGIGNGGYVCGCLAQLIGSSVEVRLYQPPPLDRPLRIQTPADGRVVAQEGDQVIAEALPASLTLEIPPMPAFEQAEAVSRNYPDPTQHPFPNCFVCGPQRQQGDGLRIFANPIPEFDCVAAIWIPNMSLVDTQDLVRPEFVWAALDCPGGIAAIAERPRPILLGRLTATLEQTINPSEPYVVTGWVIARDGRKHLTGTALFSETGQLCGYAQAVWIEPRSN